MNKSLISLSVPVYGTESFLPALLDSVLAQSCPADGSAGRESSFSHKEDTLRFPQLNCLPQSPRRAQSKKGGVKNLNPLRSLRPLRLNKKDKTSNQTGCPPIEILIADDGSPSGSALPKILKPYIKTFKKLGVDIELFKHGVNLGTLEARRTLAENARGEYIFFVDPDDTLPPDALAILTRALAESSESEPAGAIGNCGADIIHGLRAVFVHNPNSGDGVFREKYEALVRKEQKVHKGRLEGPDVLKSLLIDEEHNSLVCGKLIKTALVRKAYEEIPHTFCTMAEDFLLYFFIALQNPSYYGIDKIVYNYYNDAGITSKAEISSLERWEKACSAASVFTVIFSYLEEHPFNTPRSGEYRNAIGERCSSYLASNIRHLGRVIPSLRDKAYEILCDYWGEGYVKRAEKAIHNG